MVQIRTNLKTERARSVRSVLWYVFVLNLFVAAAKFFYGLASSSASMQADGIHSVFDSFGNIIGLLGIAVSSRPADKGHPYGHSKFETYASLAIGILLVIAALEVGSDAVGRLVAGNSSARVSFASFAVMICTLIINLSVSSYERHKAKKLESEILSADASHTLSDGFVSIGVIVGLAFVSAGYPSADSIAALVVTIFIALSAINVFRSALRILSDHACISSEEIEKLSAGMGGVKEVHAIRTRGTQAEVYCDMHLLVDGDLSVRAAHELGDTLEDKIKETFPNVKEVLIHIEPEGEAVSYDG